MPAINNNNASPCPSFVQGKSFNGGGGRLTLYVQIQEIERRGGNNGEDERAACLVAGELSFQKLSSEIEIDSLFISSPLSRIFLLSACNISSSSIPPYKSNIPVQYIFAFHWSFIYSLLNPLVTTPTLSDQVRKNVGQA